MDIRSLDRHTLESLWEANERELLQLAVMSPPEREIHANREDELLDEQDAIEFRLGFARDRLQLSIGILDKANMRGRLFIATPDCCGH